jgi:3-oxoacyl-[acyl-carrier protein] reductase
MSDAEPTTALVTGATEGIGRAIAFALGRAGYRVGVCARTAHKVQELLQALAAEGIETAGIAADVGSEAEVRAAVAHVAARLGPVETQVKNAGVGIFKPFEELTTDDGDRTVATTLRSGVRVTRGVLPARRRRRRGAIVNIASLAGRNGFVGGTAYTASKHAVLGFSKSLMAEVRKDDVRVIAICPGSVDTALFDGQSVLQPNLARALHPEDIAETVLATLTLPVRALVSELDIRPTNP